MNKYSSFYGGGGDFYAPPVNHTLDRDVEPVTAVYYVRAILPFAIGLSVYFCMLCTVWLKDGSITKEEIERSIVHKRVLAHGQSHRFDCDCNQDDDCLQKQTFCHKVQTCRPCRSVARYCCRRKHLQGISIVPASTDDIKDSNRCDPATSQTEECENTAGVDNVETKEAEHYQSNDALNELDDQAEQGLVEVVALVEEITCPICIEPLKLGEEVAWSKLGRHCRHTYHYECISKWLFEGNFHCPICRDRFWKRNYRMCNRVNVCTNLIYRKDSDPSDTMAARRYQFCEVHGLTWPTDSAEAEAAISCTSSGSVLEV